jgi:hypothetical protein
MITLYSVHDRLREKTHLYQHCDLIVFFCEISHIIDGELSTSDMIQRLEYGCVSVFTKDFLAGSRFFITRHFLEV